MKAVFDTSPKPVGLDKPITTVGLYADHALATEKKRVALQVRLAHLIRIGRTDEHAAELLARTWELEEFTDFRMKELVDSHPAAGWFGRVSGFHRASAAKIIGEVEAFGKWYRFGDSMIPSEVKREAVKDEAGDEWVFVRGIERLTNASKFDTYAGLTPKSKAKPGELLPYNKQLRTYIFRLGHFGLMMARGKYFDAFTVYKENRTAKLLADGIQILPTPMGRFCPKCLVPKTVPKTTFMCPECDTKLGGKKEPEGVIWKGHLHAQCFRWMQKLAMHHLWAVWRAAEGLSVRGPYAQEHLGHQTFIDAWDMCDFPEPKKVKLKEPSSERKRAKRIKAGQVPPPIPPLEDSALGDSEDLIFGE